MIADSADVDAAVLTLLDSDATLSALMSGGVWWNVAARGKTSHFVVVRQLTHEQDMVMPGRVGLETFVYVVESVVLVPDGSDESIVNQDAAQRIYTLLHNVTLTVPNYHPSTGCRRLVRDRWIDVDEQTNTRWDHRIGHYQVLITPQA